MKKLFSAILTLVLLFSLSSAAFALSAQRSGQNLTVDGRAVSCDKYNIDGRNYFKLRDLAQLLNGTGSQFDVGWDGKARVVTVTTGSAYPHADGNELKLEKDLSASAVRSTQTIQINGKVRSDLSVYNIGDSNYFQLRELGDLLIDVHGQNDGRRLLSEASHRAYLDGYATLGPELETYAAAYKEYAALKERLEALATQTAALYGGTAELEWADYTSPLINDNAATAEAQKTAVSLFGEDKVIRSRQPSLGGDDFAEYILRVPGVYAYIGSGNPARPDTMASQHNSHFDIDEDALTVAAALYACYAADYLNGEV